MSTFTAPTSTNSQDISISFAATDVGGSGVTGYKITETNTKPDASDAGWVSSATTYRLTSQADKLLYPWAKDMAGNVSAVFGTPRTVKWDVTLSIVTTFTLAATSTSRNIPVLAFTATDNLIVTGYKITEIATKPVATEGGWSDTALSTYTVATDGNKTLYPWAKDYAGNVSAVYTSPQAVIVDTVAPVVSIFTAPTSTNIQDISISFAVTDVGGSGVTGYMITETATQPDASDIGWVSSVPTIYHLTSSENKTLYPWAKDAAGNVSAGISRTVKWDDTLPSVTTFTLAATSNSRTITFSAFIATDNLIVTGYKITETATKPVATEGGWSDTAPSAYTVATDGNKTLYPWAKDYAGNVSAVYTSPKTVLVDTVAPVVSGFTAPTSTNSQDISISYAATDVGGSGVTGYKITETNTTPVASDAGWSATMPTTYHLSLSADRVLYPWAKDMAGNVSAVFGTPRTVKWDVTLPSVTTFTLAATSTSRSIPVSVFTASDNLAVTGYKITQTATKPAAADTGWLYSVPSSYTVVTDGNKILYPWAKDYAGNVSAVSTSPKTVLVDTVAPVVNGFTAPTSTNSQDISISFAATDVGGSGVTGYKITETNTTPVASDAGWSATMPTTYHLSLSADRVLYPWAKDMAGNVSALFGTPRTVKWDVTLPRLVTFKVAATSTSRSIPVLAFTATDNLAVTGYKITETATKPVASATGWSISLPTSYTVATDGDKKLYPWARDYAGNVSAVFGYAAIRVDSTAPSISAFTVTSPTTRLILSVPVFRATDNFGVTGYKITGTATKPLPTATGWSATAPTTYTVTKEGSYTLYPWTKDALGNVSAVFLFAVVVDITIPTSTKITGFPPEYYNQTFATLTFTGSDAVTPPNKLKFKCSLDRKAYTSCVSPFTYKGLAAGYHGVWIFSVDLGGNINFGKTDKYVGWTIDLVPPETTITKKPQAITTLKTAVFTFTGKDTVALSRFNCKLDNAVFAKCGSPKTYTGLALGKHTFSVQAVDLAGNLDLTPAIFSWIIR